MTTLLIIISILILFALVAAFNQPAAKIEESAPPSPKLIFHGFDLPEIWTGPRVPTLVFHTRYTHWFNRELAKQTEQMPTISCQIIVSPFMKEDSFWLINPREEEEAEIRKAIGDKITQHLTQAFLQGQADDLDSESENTQP